MTTFNKYPKNRGSAWYYTRNGSGPSRWRYSSVFHIIDNENEKETWCGLPLENAANAYCEQDIIDHGIEYLETRRNHLCKKCERHPNYGLIVLGRI